MNATLQTKKTRMFLHCSIEADPTCELFLGPGTSSVYSDFVKQAHEKFEGGHEEISKNKLTFRVLFEAACPECFHINGDDNSKSES